MDQFWSNKNTTRKKIFVKSEGRTVYRSTLKEKKIKKNNDVIASVTDV